MEKEKWKEFVEKVLNNESEYIIADKFESDIKSFACDIKIVYNTFLNVGFKNKEAFELTKIYMINALR